MLKLVKLEETYMPQLVNMMDEWSASGERIVPYVLCRIPLISAWMMTGICSWGL